MKVRGIPGVKAIHFYYRPIGLSGGYTPILYNSDFHYTIISVELDLNRKAPASIPVSNRRYHIRRGVIESHLSRCLEECELDFVWYTDGEGVFVLEITEHGARPGSWGIFELYHQEASGGVHKDQCITHGRRAENCAAVFSYI